MMLVQSEEDLCQYAMSQGWEWYAEYFSITCFDTGLLCMLVPCTTGKTPQDCKLSDATVAAVQQYVVPSVRLH